MTNDCLDFQNVESFELRRLKKICYQNWYRTNDYYFLSVSESNLNKLDTMKLLVEACQGKYFNEQILKLQISSIAANEQIEEAYDFCLDFFKHIPYDTLHNYSVFCRTSAKIFSTKFSFAVVESSVIDLAVYLADYLYNHLEFEKSEQLVNLALDSCLKYEVFNEKPNHQ